MKNEPIIPITPELFSDMVADRLKYLSPSYIITDDMRDGYKQFGAMFNSVCVANQKGDTPTVIVTPASTGSAKSVSAKLYLASIATQGFSGMLVVAEISDALDAAEEINTIAGDNVAGVYYKESDKNPKHKLQVDLDDLPNILVISHAMFISRSNTGKDVDKLKEFDGEQRDCIIVDERINLLKSASFGTREVEELITILKRSPSNEPYHAAMVLEAMNAEVFKRENGSFEYNEPLFHDLKVILTDLADGIRNNKYVFLSGMKRRKVNYKQEHIDMVALIDRIIFVIDERFLHTKEGRSVTLTRGENLLKLFGSIAVLDATSNINPQYAYQALNLDDITLLDRISIRKYSNATLHICNSTDIPQSKTGIFVEPKAEGYLGFVIENYLLAIDSILEPKDSLLVVTYKDLVPLLQDKCPYDNVTFVHYGSSGARGSNKYAAYNKAMVIGWFRKPKHYYNNIVASITDWDSYLPTHGSKQGDATNLERMLIIDDLAQFFNRVRCRIATTADGDCAPTDLYMFTGGSVNMEETIVDTLTSEMEGLKVVDWDITISTKLKKKKSKISERAELLVEWLLIRSREYSEISVADITEYFGWSRNIVNAVINPKKKTRDNYFTLLCEEENIVRYKEGKTVLFRLPTIGEFAPSLTK